MTRSELANLEERVIDTVQDADLRLDLLKVIELYRQLDWQVAQFVSTSEWDKFPAKLKPSEEN